LTAQVLTDTPAPRPPAVAALAALLRAHAAVTRLASARLQAEHGLSLNDYEALRLLVEAEGRRLRRVDLARSLALTPSGVTRLLEGLEEAGLVERATCPYDLRVTYAQLTELGAERLRELSCGQDGSVRALFEERLSRAEIEELARLLERLT
jgi:DNA-binding MarR family transcriptional regulator